MGLRFHRSITLLPFLRLHIAKTGISFSVGRRGTSLNIGSKGVTGSVGVPGTGLAYRKRLVSRKKIDTAPNSVLSEKSGPAGGFQLVMQLLLVVAFLCLGAFIIKNFFA